MLCPIKSILLYLAEAYSKIFSIVITMSCKYGFSPKLKLDYEKANTDITS